MSGIYGQVNFIVGKPETQKPVRSGPCAECGKTVYRETYRVGKGWVFRCIGCDPDKAVLERRYAAGSNAPMGYVPRSYEGGERSTSFDPALGAAIRRSRGEM